MAERVLGGRYTVQDKIGIGGMATVYRGLDNVLGRTVAIKTMLPQYAADPSFAARFKQEAQAAAALSSPYIVGVYDWGRDQDTYYIVMEYLRGTDLKSGIRKHGALDCRKVAQIGSQICQALSVAHGHDIIHRDIKPQNIMVLPDGNIKVMDFGIARAKNSHLTTNNSVLGTAHYVSPEQTQGKELGPTSDLYSLGIVMYECATGQVPFSGDDAISVALKQVNEQPVPPSQINPSVDSTLEGIILKCMQKDPADRYQTADELRRALNDYLAGRIISTGTATSPLSANPTKRVEKPGDTASFAQPRVSPAPMTRAERRAAEGKKPMSRGKKVGIALAIVALVAAIAAIAFALSANSAERPVPNLTGMTKEQAREEIAKSKGFFIMGNTSEDYDDSIPEGRLKSQNPAFDSQRKYASGTPIDLVFSKGKKPADQVAVPDLAGMTSNDAYKALQKANLTGQLMGSEESSTVKKGLVLRQSVDAGQEVDEGSTVQFWTSSGVGQSDAGNHVGEPKADALNALKAAGFTNVTVVAGTFSDSYDKGTVMGQSPTGTQSRDTEITLTISQGPRPVATTAAQSPQASTGQASTAPSTSTHAGGGTGATESGTGEGDKATAKR